MEQMKKIVEQYLDEPWKKWVALAVVGLVLLYVAPALLLFVVGHLLTALVSLLPLIVGAVAVIYVYAVVLNPELKAKMDGCFVAAKDWMTSLFK